jgi:hypothetical protein
MQQRVIPGNGTGKKLSKPGSKSGKMQRACLEQMLQHERDGTIPTNGRFVLYELEQQGLAHKSDSSGVTYALLYLREHEHFPWWWIEDTTRTLDSWRYAASVYEYVRQTVGRARIDLWGGEEPPLYLFESRAAQGVCRDLFMEYLAPNAPCGGQCHGFLVNEIAPLLRNNKRKVRYVGDYELRGPAEQIEASTKRILERHSGRTFTSDDWTKIALTEKQMKARPRLRQLEMTKYDKRYKKPPYTKKGKPYQAVECEALTQKVLLDIIRKDLVSLLPEPLSSVQVREQLQREDLAKALARLARKAGR